MSDANSSATNDYLPENFATGASVPPDALGAGTERDFGKKDVYGKTGFSSGRWECRASADRLVLDLPAVDSSGTQSLSLFLWMMAFVAVCSVPLLWAFGRGDWETDAGLLFCMSFFLLGAGVSFFRVARRQNREIVVERGRLLLGKATGEPGQFDEEALLADSLASVSRAGRLQIRVGQREIVLCSTLARPDAERICDQINELLKGQEAERPVYVERPGPTDAGFACDAEGDRLTLTLPPLGFDWMIWRFVGVAYITAMMIGGLWEMNAAEDAAANRPAAIGLAVVFGGAALYYLWKAIRDRFAKVQVIVEPSRLTITRELFGQSKEKAFPLDASSHADVGLHGSGTSIHHVVTIRQGGKIREALE